MEYNLRKAEPKDVPDILRLVKVNHAAVDHGTFLIPYAFTWKWVRLNTRAHTRALSPDLLLWQTLTINWEQICSVPFVVGWPITTGSTKSWRQSRKSTEGDRMWRHNRHSLFGSVDSHPPYLCKRQLVAGVYGSGGTIRMTVFYQLLFAF